MPLVYPRPTQLLVTAVRELEHALELQAQVLEAKIERVRQELRTARDERHQIEHTLGTVCRCVVRGLIC